MRKQTKNNLSDRNVKTGVKKTIFIWKLLKLNQLKTDDCLFLRFLFVFSWARTWANPLTWWSSSIQDIMMLYANKMNIIYLFLSAGDHLMTMKYLCHTKSCSHLGWWVTRHSQRFVRKKDICGSSFMALNWMLSIDLNLFDDFLNVAKFHWLIEIIFYWSTCNWRANNRKIRKKS